MKKNSFIHQPLFRITVPPLFSIVLYILILLLFGTIEELKDNFFSIEYVFITLITFSSFEMMRFLTKLTEKLKIKGKMINKVAFHILINLAATVTITSTFVVFYFRNIVGFFNMYTELVVFNLLFGLTSILYSLTYLSLYFMNQSNELLLSRENKEKERLIRELENYKSHLNPDLLNKSLEYLIGISHNDKELADSFIQKLSRFYRFSLKKQQDELIQLSEELQALENLIWILKIIYEGKVDFTNEKLNENVYLIPNTLVIVIQYIVQSSIINSYQLLKIHAKQNSESLIVTSRYNSKLFAEDSTYELKKINSAYSFYTDRQVKREVKENTIFYSIPLLKIAKENRS